MEHAVDLRGFGDRETLPVDAAVPDRYSDVGGRVTEPE
ncbi:hypothetical protein JOE59_001803 [Agromyces cerinus]|nr:hypothetical protein [Agromyces cerinus]